ncbi:hypothetical protein BBD46_06275 [Natrialba sp. SSL1]|nr:hypothetical protein BBD46_06275 [Natrialba sp. SSL1]
MPRPGESGDSEQRRRPSPLGHGLAKISLGISILIAAIGFLYFYLQAEYITAVGVAVVFLLGGWEYRRRLQDTEAAMEYEADAESRKDRRRQ